MWKVPGEENVLDSMRTHRGRPSQSGDGSEEGRGKGQELELQSLASGVEV